MSTRVIFPLFGSGGGGDMSRYATGISMTMDDSYVISCYLTNKDGVMIGTEQTIDLPIESVVVSGAYDPQTKSLVLTLQNGNTITIPVGDLVSGLQTEITEENPLSADLLTDGTTNKVFTATEKEKLDGLTVNDATITIQQNGTTVGTFTTNDDTDTTINLTGGGNTVKENPILLPFYFENISDSDIDVTLAGVKNQYGGYLPSINLSKSSNNSEWTAIEIQNDSATITIPAKSRVYLKGTNTRFCNFQSSGYYNHWCFSCNNSYYEYVYVGGNLMSLLMGDTFLTAATTKTLDNYAFAKLFNNNINAGHSGSTFRHFENMVCCLPKTSEGIFPTTGSFDYIYSYGSALDLSNVTFLTTSANYFNCCRGMFNVIVPIGFTKAKMNCLTDNINEQINYHIGYTESAVGISDYRQLTNIPTMATETLTFIDANNVSTTVVFYTQPQN